MMERIPQSPPVIAPLSNIENRPVLSVMIPIYNGSQHLKDAIECVLIQDAGLENMQIEVVDDCSTDADIEKMVAEIGKGRVAYYRQEKNVGSLRNFETCLNRARGHYVHMLHCDDKVKAGFYTELLSLFEQFPQAVAAFCGHDSIDNGGSLKGTSKIISQTPCILDNLLYILAERQPIQYVSIIVKREVYEKLGAFFGVTYGEDWIMWARIAKDYPVAYSPKALAQYRKHDFTISTTSLMSGKSLRDMKFVIDHVTELLPPDKQRFYNRKARKNYAVYCVLQFESLYNHRIIPNAPFRQLYDNLKFYADFQLFFQTLKFVIRIFLKPVKRLFKPLKNKAVVSSKAVL